MSKVSSGRFFLSLVIGSVLIILVFASCAPTEQIPYPERAVTLIVPVAPGGSMDLTARALAEGSKLTFGQPFVIVNKPGGGTAIGTTDVVQTKPDGYTIGILYGAGLSYVPQLQSVPYKGPDDIQPIINTIDASNGVVVKAEAPWKTMKELIDYAKGNPGKVKVGTPGAGSTGQIVLQRLEQVTGAKFTEVPLPGAASDQLKALLGNTVDVIHTTVGSVTGQAQAGQVRGLAMCYPKRMGGYWSNVPTMREAGYDVVTVSTYFFIGGPKGLPKAIVQKLYDTFDKVLKGNEFQKLATDNSWIMESKGPDDLVKQLKSDYDYFTDFLKKTTTK